MYQIREPRSPKDMAQNVGRLKALKESNNRASFNDLLSQVLIPVRKYVEHEIQVAEINGVIPKTNYQTSELMDDLRIKTFDDIAEIDVQQHLVSWLFQQADIMLEDLFVEEEFNAFFFKNIDDLTKVEMATMEEKITRDGDGDLLLVEELDDMSYMDYQYVLDDVFIHDVEKSIIQSIDENLLREKAEGSIKRMMRYLPYRMRSIYNLHHHGLDPRSISYIKRMPEDRVNDTIHKTRETLRHFILLGVEDSQSNKK